MSRIAYWLLWPVARMLDAIGTLFPGDEQLRRSKRRTRKRR
jgi:hypothetical protein